MTTGLDEGESFECTDADCLTCLTAPGERWFYHNAPYTLTQEVLKNASGLSPSLYFKNRLGDNIGASGLFVNLGFNKVFISRSRDMARFGLLVLAQGNWDGTSIYAFDDYFQQMAQSSQLINPSYGYLWWLNGKENYVLPGFTFSYDGSLVSTAPDDMYAAMGKNDQRLYIVPSQNLVVVRLGNAADNETLALSDFDNNLWEKISSLDCLLSATEELKPNKPIIYPNPSGGEFFVEGDNIEKLELYDLHGNFLNSFSRQRIKMNFYPPGIYLLKIIGRSSEVQWKRVVFAP